MIYGVHAVSLEGEGREFQCVGSMMDCRLEAGNVEKWVGGHDWVVSWGLMAGRGVRRCVCLFLVLSGNPCILATSVCVMVGRDMLPQPFLRLADKSESKNATAMVRRS